MAIRRARDMTLVKIYLHEGRTVVVIPVIGRDAARVVAELHVLGVTCASGGPAIVEIRR